MKQISHTVQSFLVRFHNFFLLFMGPTCPIIPLFPHILLVTVTLLRPSMEAAWTLAPVTRQTRTSGRDGARVSDGGEVKDLAEDELSPSHCRPPQAPVLGAGRREQRLQCLQDGGSVHRPPRLCSEWALPEDGAANSQRGSL